MSIKRGFGYGSLFFFFLVIGGPERIVGAKAADGGLAWAQESGEGDSAGGALASPNGKNTPLPNVAGAWCGSIQDNNLGSGQIHLSINQNGKLLSGTWTDNLGRGGRLTGKVKKSNAVVAKLFNRDNNCKLMVNGILVEPDEITGNFSQFGCRQADGGSFDITSPTCDQMGMSNDAP